MPPWAGENLCENIREKLNENWCEKRVKQNVGPRSSPLERGAPFFFQPTAGLIFQHTVRPTFQLTGVSFFNSRRVRFFT